jgi:steroid delta-isomerase-like uncharacterized protein
MTSEEYAAEVANLLNEVFNKKNPAIILEAFADDCIASISGYREPFVGGAAFKAWAESYLRGFDCEVAVEDVRGEGSSVMLRWNMRAVHRGEYLGMPATFRQVHWRALEWTQFEGDKVKQVWVAFDTMGIAQDLGIFPKGNPPRPLAALIA